MKMRTAAAITSLSMALLLSLYAQTTPASLPKASTVSEFCQSLAKGNKHAEVLENTCQFALTVQKALPSYICQEKIKRSICGNLFDVTELQVTVANGEGSYSNIRVDGKPVKASFPGCAMCKGDDVIPMDSPRVRERFGSAAHLLDV